MKSVNQYKFRGDKILLIRKNGFTELVSFETEQVTHEMGDKITDKRVREAIMGWIADNRIDLIKECEKANRLNYNPKQFS